MSTSKHFLISLVVFISIFDIFVSAALTSNGENVAFLEIERAEGIMVLAYDAALEAEKVGVNVSDLLVKLNDGAEALIQARVLYKARDFDGAVRFAGICSEIGESVRRDAYKLKDLAVKEAGERFRWTMVGSIAGVGVIIFATFLSWRAFKRRYYRRILRMKPEVVSGES